MRYGVNGTYPGFEIDDMLPGGPNEHSPPGLTLGYIPMPCLSPTGRRTIECGTGSGPLPIPFWTVLGAWAPVTIEVVPAE